MNHAASDPEKAVSRSGTLYTCPLHQQPLTSDGRSARCPMCEEPYPIEHDIWLLDVVRRGDRTAFDEQVQVAPIPLDLSKAEYHLKAAGVRRFERVAILDVGCGLGDMTASLAASERIRFSDIYAFDHSIESLRIALANTPPVSNGNQIHFSAQDAARLFFADESFDFIAGSAVLHHITDYVTFMRQIFRLLKPGCRAVFSEPFLGGYLWPSFFLQVAANELGLSSLDAEEFGMGGFILQDTTYRVRHARDLPALDGLTDKHYFRDEVFATECYDIGFRKVSFQNAEPDEFYHNWMEHFLNVYRVRHAALRERAIALYAQLSNYLGPSLPEIVPHFKYIVLEK